MLKTDYWAKDHDSSMFGTIRVIVFQIIFRVEMHANDFFLFFKNYF
jgi:hypothetical protein